MGAVTLANMLLSKPDPVEAIGRVIKLMDGKRSGAQGMNTALAIEQAREWASEPCGPTLKPVQDVLVALLAHIDTLKVGAEEIAS